VAFVRNGQIVVEIKMSKRQQKSWAKMWHWGERGFDDGNTFENIMSKIGRKIDDGQLEIVKDFTIMQIDINQYNGRVIDVTIKCKTWDEMTNG
jgi:hypothetical protein